MNRTAENILITLLLSFLQLQFLLVCFLAARFPEFSNFMSNRWAGAIYAFVSVIMWIMSLLAIGVYSVETTNTH